MKRCVMCNQIVWFWQAKRFFKSPEILNPVGYNVGWCHRECEEMHFKYLIRYYLQPERTPMTRLYCEPAKNLGELSGMAPCEPIYGVAINATLCEHFTEDEINMIVKYWSEQWGLDGK